MLTPQSPQVWKGADRVLAALEAVEAGDHVTAMGGGTVAALGALRARVERTPEERQAFDLLGSETLTWLRRESAALRFTKAHRAEE